MRKWLFIIITSIGWNLGVLPKVNFSQRIIKGMEIQTKLTMIMFQWTWNGNLLWDICKLKQLPQSRQEWTLFMALRVSWIHIWTNMKTSEKCPVEWPGRESQLNRLCAFMLSLTRLSSLLTIVFLCVTLHFSDLGLRHCYTGKHFTLHHRSKVSWCWCSENRLPFPECSAGHCPQVSVITPEFQRIEVEEHGE